MVKSTAAIAMMIGAIVVGISGRSVRYTSNQCSNNEECNPGECCVLSGNRYSIPQCAPLLEEGATCRPNDLKLNTTLVYPDGNFITITAFYEIICPCTFGLSCDVAEGGVCRDLSQKRGFNSLLNDVSTQDD